MLVLATLSVSCDGGIDTRLENARAIVAQGEAEIASAREALTSNDQDAAGEHIAAAQVLFLHARDAYLQARADESRDPAILDEFAVLATRNEDYDLTAKAYRRAAEFSPERADYWLAAGRNFVRVGPGMSEEARESLLQCIEVAMASGDEAMLAQARSEMGHLHRSLGLYELAREDYEASVGMNAEQPRAHIAMAGLDFRDGNVADAAARVDALGNLDAESTEFLGGMLVLGFSAFRDSRGWFPDTAENHLAYARLLTRMPRYADALQAVQRAHELNERDIVTLNLLGSLALQTGDSERAMRAFDQSLAIEPNQPRTREALDQIKAASPSA